MGPQGQEGWHCALGPGPHQAWLSAFWQSTGPTLGPRGPFSTFPSWEAHPCTLELLLLHQAEDFSGQLCPCLPRKHT